MSTGFIELGCKLNDTDTCDTVMILNHFPEREWCTRQLC